MIGPSDYLKQDRLFPFIRRSTVGTHLYASTFLQVDT